MKKNSVRLKYILLVVCLFVDRPIHSFDMLDIKILWWRLNRAIPNLTEHLMSFFGGLLLMGVGYFLFSPYKRNIANARFIPYDTSNKAHDENSYVGTVPQQVSDIIEQIKNPDNNELITKGFILTGRPGCGKTSLAKIIACQLHLDCPVFIVNSSSDLLGSILAQTEANIKQLFEDARKAAKGSKTKKAMIFIDEIHSICNKGSADNPGLTTFLAEINGPDSIKNSGIIVIGATNKYHLLDAALIRSGRLNVSINIEPITVQDCEGIIKKNLVSYNLSNTIISFVAQFIGSTPTPADVAQICKNINMDCAQKKHSIFKSICTQIVAYKKLLRCNDGDARQKKQKLKEFLKTVNFFPLYMPNEQKEDFGKIYSDICIDRYRYKIQEDFRKFEKTISLNRKVSQEIFDKYVLMYQKKELKKIESVKVFCKKIYANTTSSVDKINDPLKIIDQLELEYSKANKIT